MDLICRHGLGGWDDMWSSVETGGLNGVVSSAPCARAKHSATLLGGYVYVLAGRGAGGAVPLRDFWRYSLTTGRWEKLECRGDPPPSLQDHTVTAHESKLYVFGGEAGALSNETPLWIYDTETRVWRKLPCLSSYTAMKRRGSKDPRCASVGPRGRRGHSAHALKDCLLIYGGYKDLRGSTNELWAFHYDGDMARDRVSWCGGGPGAAPARGDAARDRPLRARRPVRPARHRRPLALRHAVARVAAGACAGAAVPERAQWTRGAPRGRTLLHLRRRGARPRLQRPLAFPLRDGDVGTHSEHDEVALPPRRHPRRARVRVPPARALRTPAAPRTLSPRRLRPRPTGAVLRVPAGDLEAVVVPRASRGALFVHRAERRARLHREPGAPRPRPAQVGLGAHARPAAPAGPGRLARGALRPAGADTATQVVVGPVHDRRRSVRRGGGGGRAVDVGLRERRARGRSARAGLQQPALPGRRAHAGLGARRRRHRAAGPGRAPRAPQPAAPAAGGRAGAAARRLAAEPALHVDLPPTLVCDALDGYYRRHTTSLLKPVRDYL